MNKGFTLPELLIACAIIGIITCFALPVYSTHLLHANRLAAELQLIKITNALEQFHLAHHSYQDATIAKLGLDNSDTHHSYQLVITSATIDDYTIVAIPQGAQLRDTECATLTLEANGTRGITGTGYAKNCWQ